MNHLTKSLTKLLLSATAALLPLLASTAFAQEQCGDTTCDKGYTCEEGVGPCPLILCEEGSDCTPCEPEPIEYCAPAACGSDTDCAEYMACVSFPTQECPEQTPECTAGVTDDECAALWEAWRLQCVDSEIQQCAPRWSLPCQEASDCGDGFECMPQEICTACRGDASNDRDVVCDCTTSDTGYCQAIEQACDDDGDCLDHWVCGENYNSVCSDDGSGNFTCEPANPPMICHPKAPGGGFATLAADVAALEDGAAAPIAQSSGDPTPATADGNDRIGLAAPTRDDTVAAPEAATADADLEANGMSSNGCAVASTSDKGNPALPTLLLGLGLVATGLRRRPR